MRKGFLAVETSYFRFLLNHFTMSRRYLLGFDVGSSSVKASLVDADSGECAASAFYPESEAPIKAEKAGWAEQDPESWWTYAKMSLKKIMADSGAKGEDIIAIGISYQMHGLVCVDKDLNVLRPSIIWCDSRAVPYGEKAFNELGAEQCLGHLLNSPGNFTAAKLAWVKANEPELFEKVYKFMLPGDYLAMRLSGTVNTTISGLSEGMFWDFREKKVADFLMRYFGFNQSLVPDIVPTFSVQSEVSAAAAAELGLKEGTPISYRAGDQPNNALSLNVFNPGEIASTAGTSGVVYGVLGEINYDMKSRVNTFAHVNYTKDLDRLGVLLCINGTGILNAWVRRTIAQRCRARAREQGGGMLHQWRQLQQARQGSPDEGCPGRHRLQFLLWHGNHAADGHGYQEDTCRKGQHVPQPALPRHPRRSEWRYHRTVGDRR